MHLMEISRSLVEIEHRINGLYDSLRVMDAQLQKLLADFKHLNSLIAESTQSPTVCDIKEYISGASYPEI
jgi:hypothetical protein